MTEEVQVIPKWLKELEEKREKRLKARLGHEAGAGSPCLTCEEKCPGLDLHFWRKICKNCKCGKESHDVNDDDIYGWAQFQLVGSKPNKSKKFVLPGRRDAVELDWIPKGVADAVELYLKELPINLLPIKGSMAALERKQLLQKQIPLHDIDPTLCHALSENEIKQMKDYIADVKENSVGVGHILKLQEIVMENRPPMQIPQMENIILQGADRANHLIQKNLQDSKLNDNKLPTLVPNRHLCNEIDFQNPTEIKNVHDVKYGTNEHYSTNRPGSLNPKNLANYTAMPNNNTVDFQNPHALQNVRDINNSVSKLILDEDKNDKFLNNNALFPNQLFSNQIDNQDPLKLHIKDLQYPTNELQTSLPNYKKQIANQTVSGNCNGNVGNLLIPNSEISNNVDNQYITHPGHIKDITYTPSYDQNTMATGELKSGVRPYNSDHVADLQFPQKTINNQIDDRFPMHLGRRDINYATLQNARVDEINGPKLFDNMQLPSNLKRNEIDNQNPTSFHLQNPNYLLERQNLDRNYTDNYQNQRNDSPYIEDGRQTDRQQINTAISDSTDFKRAQCSNLQIPASSLQNTIDQQIPIQTGNVCDINYPINTIQQASVNKNRPSATSIKDLVYSTYDPQPSNNPDEVNASPMAVNIGSIKDIEYPTENSVMQTQDISEPAIPRKNVSFNLVPDEILPCCHRCHKMFNSLPFVIGIDHTDALWHADCFRCAGCNQNLADLMYFYDKSSNDIFCGRDYAKIRGIPRCQACDELIFVKEYCLAENSTFHVKHFCCYECDVPLAGQNYVMEDSQPLCLPCFELLKAEKCNTCLKVIKPDEQGAKLKDVHFHADDNCFVCKMCKKQLLSNKFLFKNANLYCSAPCFGADK